MSCGGLIVLQIMDMGILKSLLMEMVMLMFMRVQVNVLVLIGSMNMEMGMEEILDDRAMILVHSGDIEHAVKQFMGLKCEGELQSVRLQQFAIV